MSWVLRVGEVVTQLVDRGVAQAPRRRSTFLNYTALSPRRARFYSALAVFLLIWLAVYTYLVVEVIPLAIYWISYYSADYSAGFVRRGLAGEIPDAFPEQQYFTVVYALTWGAVVAYCAGLAFLAYRILFSGFRSERRLMVAFLIPVLPFAVTFALFGPRPELYGAAALIAFTLLISRRGSNRAALILSACFGSFLALLAFVHEAIPLEFALGSVLAIAVVGGPAAARARRACMALTVLPGLLASGVVMLATRANIGKQQLCAMVPHGQIENPFVVPPGRQVDYLLGRYDSVTDYHDWVCRSVVPYFGGDFSDALRSVANQGLPVLAGGFLHGLLVVVGSVWLIQYFTGVSWKQFVGRIRGGLGLPLVALALMVPLFATGVDWIRWWTLIAINIGVVYLVFAAGRPEMERPVSSRQLKIFAAAALILAFVPFSGPTRYSTDWVTF